MFIHSSHLKFCKKKSLFSSFMEFPLIKNVNISDTPLLSQLMFSSNFSYIRGCLEFINLWYGCLDFTRTRPYPCKESSTFSSVHHRQGRRMSHQQDETAQWEPKAAFPALPTFLSGISNLLFFPLPLGLASSQTQTSYIVLGSSGTSEHSVPIFFLNPQNSCLICLPFSVIKMRL